MPDIVTFASTGVVYRNGRVVTGVTQLGTYKTINPKVDRTVIVAQSGQLDSRFDDTRYYSGDTTA